MKYIPINLEIGRIGEDIAAQYLSDKGFDIVSRNYRKKVGEIDIVAEKTGTVHFVEVKAVSRENVSPKISNDFDHRPEENVHKWKIDRLGRAISLYLQEYHSKKDINWQVDVIALEINQINKTVHLNFIKDIII
jgi:putative endonuclease